MPDKHEQAALTILKTTEEARRRLNEFSARVLRTRGGRIGSGMGAVIEALWGFFVNQILLEDAKCRIELAWMYGHEYNDFACIGRGAEWHPETRAGELLRVEVKSMVASADESKAHFDRLRHELHETDLLAVFLWDWLPVPAPGGPPPVGGYVSPQVKDYFVGRASDIAALRDALHRERGGTFVESGTCPDNCAVDACTHIGEPLNAKGSRERPSGPSSTRTKTVSHQANFGGLVRMLGCRTPQARSIVRKFYAENSTVKTYLDFAARNFLRVAKVLRE